MNKSDQMQLKAALNACHAEGFTDEAIRAALARPWPHYFPPEMIPGWRTEYSLMDVRNVGWQRLCLLQWWAEAEE